MSVVVFTVVLAGCGGTITPTRPNASTPPPTTTPAAGGAGGVSTLDPPGGDGQGPGGQPEDAGGQPEDGGPAVSPLKIADFTISQGIVWSIYKPSADKYIAEGCGAAGLAADCVGIDIDTTGDPSNTTIHPCGILEWDRKDPLYAGDRVTVKLQSPCSDDGFTAGEGGAGGGSTDVTDPTAITDPTDITDGTDPTDITNNTDSTEDTAGGDGDGGESTTSQ